MACWRVTSISLLVGRWRWTQIATDTDRGFSSMATAVGANSVVSGTLWGELEDVDRFAGGGNTEKSRRRIE